MKWPPSAENLSITHVSIWDKLPKTIPNSQADIQGGMACPHERRIQILLLTLSGNLGKSFTLSRLHLLVVMIAVGHIYEPTE